MTASAAKIKDDSIQILQGVENPTIMSFGLYTLCGSVGCGKSTQMFKLKDQYIKQSALSDYNLDEPFILNGSFTHIYFISPTAHLDKTLQVSMKRKKHVNAPDTIFIEGETGPVLDMIDGIKNMNERVQYILELQDTLRKCLKNSDIQRIIESEPRDIQEMQDLQELINVITTIEQMKARYTALITKESDKTVMKYMKKLYAKFNIIYDNTALRIPKIMLLFDDMSGTKLFTNSVENDFYKFIIQRRHHHVFMTAIVIHSITGLYYQFRVNVTAMILFNGLKQEQLRDYFETIQQLNTYKFGKKEFEDLYLRNVAGFYEDNLDAKNKYKHNFMYVIIQPSPQIYMGFDKRLM